MMPLSPVGSGKVAAVLLAVVLGLVGCRRESVDWLQAENFFLKRDTKTLADGTVEMRFVSLVNAPAEGLFNALSDVGNHDKFIEGVTESKVLSTDGNKRIVDITNRVLGRPNRAKIEWTIDHVNRRMSFRTLESDITENSADYHVEGSPDGRRALVTTVYHLRDKGGHPFPLHSLKLAIEDAYGAAVRGVKQRALRPSAAVG
jgi:hypothetical protein